MFLAYKIQNLRPTGLERNFSFNATNIYQVPPIYEGVWWDSKRGTLTKIWALAEEMIKTGQACPAADRADPRIFQSQAKGTRTVIQTHCHGQSHHTRSRTTAAGPTAQKETCESSCDTLGVKEERDKPKTLMTYGSNGTNKTNPTTDIFWLTIVRLQMDFTQNVWK